ncbi:phosphotransferase [Ideonella livida]|uniref:Phosphotransferase n=1 Tax=Ideonella livida TaxID=2707176 RepID=A0A7C9TNM0_9BURK|nr:phosphotransferase [Ideonella livida]NDY93665.1 phosphotransferase [Ideonella livida]
MTELPSPASPDPAAPPARSPLALDREALHAWLRPRLPGCPDDPAALGLERLAGGQSNPTWLLRAGPAPDAPAWVLRAKPGPAASLLPSAHAIEREARVLRALAGTPVPVPAVRLESADESVIGGAFYVMDFVPGRIFRDASLPGLAAAERRAVHAEAVRVIAALHEVDVAAAGLHDFGRHGGFFERQLARWTRQYQASLTEEGPCEAMLRLIDWLPQHLPRRTDAQAVALTHGDYRLENLIFHPSRPQVLAVLDWELSTLGHPLSDLAYFCMAWHLPAGGALRGFARPGQNLGALGIPSQEETVGRYLARRGLAAQQAAVQADWPFYLAFNFFRLAAILQGIRRRVAEGTASSPTARETGAQASTVAALGWALARHGGAG